MIEQVVVTVTWGFILMAGFIMLTLSVLLVIAIIEKIRK